MHAPPVQYVTTSDGYRIAYTVTGTGRPFVLMHPLGHVQNDWINPASAPWLQALSQRMQLVQYDCRGQGMSTRGLRDDLSPDDFERDLDSLVERLQLDKFVLLGSFWFGHVAVRYAVKHPERIHALVMLHCPARITPAAVGPDLARRNWSVFLEALVTAPKWTADQRLAAIESFRQSVTQADWLLKEAAFSESDVSELLPLLDLPILVLHARDNNRSSLQESADFAASAPNARLTLIDGSSQLGDGASGGQAIEAFLRDLAASEPRDGTDAPHSALRESHGLSAREVEVLRLLAAGKSNAQIADDLVISQNTVIRHVSNIFAKIGVENRAQAGAYARDHGIA